MAKKGQTYARSNRDLAGETSAEEIRTLVTGFQIDLGHLVKVLVSGPQREVEPTNIMAISSAWRWKRVSNTAQPSMASYPYSKCQNTLACPRSEKEEKEGFSPKP